MIFWICRNTRTELRTTAKEVALLYHRLHQLHLTGLDGSGESSRFFSDAMGATLSLSAVNLAESAGPAIDPFIFAEIYVTAALRAKQSYPRWLCWTERFYLSKARKVCLSRSAKNGENLPPALHWLCSPAGHRFFVSHSWNYNSKTDSLFSSLSSKADPLAYVMRVCFSLKHVPSGPLTLTLLTETPIG